MSLCLSHSLEHPCAGSLFLSNVLSNLGGWGYGGKPCLVQFEGMGGAAGSLVLSNLGDGGAVESLVLSNFGGLLCPICRTRALSNLGGGGWGVGRESCLVQFGGGGEEGGTSSRPILSMV